MADAWLAAARLALLLSLAEESDSVVVAGESRLKRRYPLPAEDPAAARSVYLAGLPKDADEEAVKELLAQAKQAASFLSASSIDPTTRIATLASASGARTFAATPP